MSYPFYRCLPSMRFTDLLAFIAGVPVTETLAMQATDLSAYCVL